MVVEQFKKLSVIMPIYALLTLVSPAFGQSDVDIHPFLTDKFIVHMGAFFPHQDLDIRIDGSVGAPEIDGESNEFDFDEAAGLSRDTELFAAEMTWRFGKKWSLRAQYFEEGASNSIFLEEDIEWGDNVLEAGSSFTMGTDFELVRAFFGRAFDSNPRHEFGAGLGIHRIKLSAFAIRDIIINFAETNAVAASGPLPNIGTWYYYSPSEKWYFGGRLDWLQVSLGDYAGGLLNVAAGANYQLWDHIGIGLSYQLFAMNVDIKSENWRGRAERRFEGLYVYLSGNW